MRKKYIIYLHGFSLLFLPFHKIVKMALEGTKYILINISYFYEKDIDFLCTVYLVL